MLKMTCWENYASILVWILSWSLGGHLIKLCMYTYSGCLTLNILQKKKKRIRFLYFSGLDFKAIKFFSWSTLSSLLILHTAKSAGIRKLFVGFCWLFIQNIILYLPAQFCGLTLSTKAKKENSVWLSNKSVWTCCWTQLFAFRDTVSNECYILSIVNIFRVYLSEIHVAGTIGISHQRCRNMGRSKLTNSKIKWSKKKNISLAEYLHDTSKTNCKTNQKRN